jgi:ABC-type Co2+ transport system permease subunit
MVDLYEFVKRLIKYIVLGIVIAIVAFTIPKKSLNVEEIVFIALSAAASFAILDLFAPSIGNAARQGAGLSIGAGIAGGLPMGGNALRLR